MRQDRKVRAAIQGIDGAAWTPIPYWLSTPEVSSADVAETTYPRVSASKQPITVRLIVGRVRPTPGLAAGPVHRLGLPRLRHDRAGEVLELEADHRRHAVVEQAIAELKSAGLAHPPSGRFTANAAWLALAVTSHNLARAEGALTGHDLDRATLAALHRSLFTIPGRLGDSARNQHLRLPQRWPWAIAFTTALTAITAIAARC